MCAVRSIFRIACPVLLFLLGLVQLLRGILARYAPLPWTEKINNFFDDSVPWYSEWAWWGLLMVLPLGVFVFWLQGGFGRNLLILKGESGQPLKIREIAVNRYVHDYLETLPFVRNARVKSRAAAGSLALKINVHITSAGPLDNLQRRILEQATLATQQGLGIQRIGDIDLCFESVHLSRNEAKKKTAENASKSEMDARRMEHEPQEPASAGAAAEPDTIRHAAPDAEAPGDFLSDLASSTDTEDEDRSSL